MKVFYDFFFVLFLSQDNKKTRPVYYLNGLQCNITLTSGINIKLIIIWDGKDKFQIPDTEQNLKYNMSNF